MNKSDKIKVNGITMFYNGIIPGTNPINCKHVLVSNRRKVGTSCQDMVLGEMALREVVKSGVIILESEN